MNEKFEDFWDKLDEDYISELNAYEAMKVSWKECKQQILIILQKPLQNLDLSQDECDSRYIEEIKKL